MNTSFGASMSDDDVLQDMEQQLYNPLPDGFVEQDWLELPAIERDWLELPAIERDWLDLPAIERDWEVSPNFEGAEQERPLPIPEDNPGLDLDF